ncbi:TraR/DksA family transcriptional regulator [Massilia arenosa]|uniref:TraR/DksA family transcriptional regulator n=1 Tax=Zemynaea arenosa TaxID=2561931 RepID=A0A4Y9SGW6_9BURK|nr:TraR/DksA family transcriptional regulator [Massilia arenosa]TFW23579.1 TraR/DksA family transcriptional regulator [Massilia arenosa]
MHQLNSSDKSELQRILNERRTALHEAIRDRLHGRDDSEQRAIFNHFADGDSPAEATLLENLDVAVLEHEFRELRAVDAALKRLDFGAAGICAECGGPIAVERLRAEPTALTCIHCQQRIEEAARQR